MNQVKSIFKNTSWSVSQLITGVCAFVLTVLIARYLGVSDYGILSFAVSFTGVFGVLMDIGMNTYAIREISRFRDCFDLYVGNIVPFKFS